MLLLKMLLSIIKATLALWILAFTSWSLSPFWSTTNPRYVKLITSSKDSPASVIGSIRCVLSRKTLVLFLFQTCLWWYFCNYVDLILHLFVYGIKGLYHQQNRDLLAESMEFTIYHFEFAIKVNTYTCTSNIYLILRLLRTNSDKKLFMSEKWNKMLGWHEA